MRQPARYVKIGFIVAAGVACASQPRPATPQQQSPQMNDMIMSVPGGCVTPVANRTSDVGCYLTAVSELGTAPNYPVYWHVHTFPNRASAENAHARGTIVESFGKVWLFTMAGADWRPASGDFVARIGPLPLMPGKAYTVRYHEATFIPGMHTASHRHSGPEAWYVVDGAQCLETPDGITVVRAGESAIVPGGPPMLLSSVGTAVRHALVVIVHDSSLPASTPALDWNAKGLCPK